MIREYGVKDFSKKCEATQRNKFLSNRETSIIFVYKKRVYVWANGPFNVPLTWEKTRRLTVVGADG